MVATHSQSRRPSNKNGSMGQSSTRPKRRSSLRRQSDKSASSILPPTTTAPSMSLTSSSRGHGSERRSRSVSGGSHQQSQHISNRRPSAPATVAVPKLSIADKFLSTNYSAPPLPITDLVNSHQKRSSSSNITASNSLVLSNSTSSEVPIAENNSRLSVADRFMNSNTSAPSTNSTLNLSGTRHYRERSGSLLSNNPATVGSSATLSDNVSGRLTIASAFIKSSSSLLPSSFDNARSYADPFDENSIDVINGNIKSNRYTKPSAAIHPLEEEEQLRTGSVSLFDDSQYLNLDLSIKTPLSMSSSGGLNSNNVNSRPWGSQATLVHHFQQSNSLERKQPIYAQFIESEKNATMMSDNRSSSDTNDKRTITMSDDVSIKHGFDDYEDVEIGYSKYSKYHGHERQWSYEDEGGDEEKSYRESHISSNALPTTKLKGNTREQYDSEQSLDQDYNNTQGFWVGCCFVSCGQRPSKKSIGQQQKQRREKEIDVDMKPKNRGFGRRGWVFCTFLSILLFILITYFLWPRTPLMRIEGASLTSPAKITETRQGMMVGNVAFESEWLVNITVDNRQNHVPTRLVQVQVLAKDALTGLVIGKGLHNDDPNPEHIILAPNVISTIRIPIRVDYQARDSTDTTFVDLTKACTPQQLIPFNSPESDSRSNQREALPLHFWISLHFFGLDWLGYKPTVIATPATGGFACPQS